jgi:hypothetical protein
MLRSPGGEEKWLLNEISSHNVPVKRRSFPKEASEQLRDVMDAILTLALSLHKNSPLAFSAYSLFVLFPRLLLRPLPNGFQRRFADAALKQRFLLYVTGDICRLLTDSYEAQTQRVTTRVLATSEDTVSFSKTARVAILAGAGEVGRACKVAYTFGLETNPEVAATFLKKLTLQSRHNHIVPHSSTFKPAKNWIPAKAISEAF